MLQFHFFLSWQRYDNFKGKKKRKTKESQVFDFVCNDKWDRTDVCNSGNQQYQH